MPAITYQQVSGRRNHTLDGTDTMTPYGLRITCWAEGYSQAELVSVAVMGALNDYTGTVNDLTIQEIHLDTDSDVIERAAGKDLLTRFGKDMYLNVWFNE